MARRPIHTSRRHTAKPRPRNVQPLPADQDTSPIVKFSGRYRFLSNFFLCGTRVVLPIAGDAAHTLSARVPSIEHAYQALKAATRSDMDRILDASTPAEARRIGRAITPRAGWEAERIAAMRALIVMKFANSDRGGLLCDALLATGDRELVEGNTWGDDFWGMVGAPIGHARKFPVDCRRLQVGDVLYIGHNWLGQILMERRSAIRAGVKGERRREIR